MTHRTKFVFSAIPLLIVLNCSKQDRETSSSRADTVLTPVMESPISLRVSPSQLPNHASAQVATWRYQKTTDGAGSPVYRASLTASNTLQFAYPYTGGSTATLTVRKGIGDTNVYVEVSNGQFNRSFQGGNARVRFDGKPPVTYTLSAAANGRANIVFFDAAAELAGRIRTARTVTMQVEFPGQRVQKIEFNTVGLRWNH